MVGRTLFAAALGIASLASTAYGFPIGKRQNIDDVVLQFALTLEHLENVFYKQALLKFSVDDFIAAGYSADYYNNLMFIAFDEQTHVQALAAALTADGVTPNAACTYNFPYTDVPSFITLSSVLEGVGTSAYLGAAGLITSKAYLTVAGSILSVEALHTSMQRLAIGEVPMANAFETPLDPMSVFTLASMFIVSCPSTNMALPFTAFPTLMVDATTCTCEEPSCGSPSDYLKSRAVEERGWPSHSGEPWTEHHGVPESPAPPSNGYPAPSPAPSSNMACAPPMAGASVTLTSASDIAAGSYVTFVSGLTVTSVQGSISGANITVTIPAGIAGQSYVFVTMSDVEGTFSDTQVISGPAVLEVTPAPPALDFSQA